MNYIYYLDLFGSSVFAVSGAILATRKNMDVFGVIVVGFVTAIGGGTLRDVLIGRTPVFWLSDKNYIILILIVSLLTFSFATKILRVKNVLRMADAIGLGTFTIIGIKIGLDGGLSNFFAIIMGMMTAAFGGVIRDVLCRETPLILNREIYATASLAGGIVFFLMQGVALPENITITISISTIIAIRLVSLKFGWNLPKKDPHG